MSIKELITPEAEVLGILAKDEKTPSLLKRFLLANFLVLLVFVSIIGVDYWHFLHERDALIARDMHHLSKVLAHQTFWMNKASGEHFSNGAKLYSLDKIVQDDGFFIPLTQYMANPSLQARSHLSQIDKQLWLKFQENVTKDSIFATHSDSSLFVWKRWKNQGKQLWLVKEHRFKVEAYFNSSLWKVLVPFILAEFFLWMLLIRSQRSHRQRHKIYRLLGNMATTDPLTGLPNRRSFDTTFLREAARSHRHQRPLSLLMLDLDHFKKINDDFGHQTGDEVLKLFSREFRQCLRLSDYYARIGGEEFAALLPECNGEQASEIAQRIVEKIGRMDFSETGAFQEITLSIGVTQYSRGESPDSTLARADRALYKAKHNGRNQQQFISKEDEN